MESSKLPSYVSTNTATSSHLLVGFFGLLAVGLIVFGISLLPKEQRTYPLVSNTPKPLPAFNPTHRVVVDISGAVAKPGIQRHSLAFGESLRIADVVASAGGFTKDADTALIAKQVNLAASVTDGYKLYVPRRGEEPILSSFTTKTISLNTASKEDLTNLKGIGESRAQTIIDNRPYSSEQEFLTKTGISQSIFDGFKKDISFN